MPLRWASARNSPSHSSSGQLVKERTDVEKHHASARSARGGQVSGQADGQCDRWRAIERREGEKRASHEERVAAAIEEAGADLVCLAGFMRLLSPTFVARFARRIVNVHPSLLPAFPGLEAQRQALEHGARVAGATVHLVDAGTDTGPIAGQEAVPVLDDDDDDALAARILEAEHRLYAGTLARLLAGGWRLEGRRLRYQG